MSEYPESPVRLSIASAPAYLPVVRAALEKVCELMGFEEDARGRIVLAVDEALTNIIRHAYGGQPGQPIEITFRRVEQDEGGAALEIELRDWGEPTDPRKIRSRDLQDVRPGGLGVHIMHKVMDHVEYAPAEGGTCLRMLRKLQPRSEE